MPEYADVFPVVTDSELPFVQTREDRQGILDAYRDEDDRLAERGYVYPDPYPGTDG